MVIAAPAFFCVSQRFSSDKYFKACANLVAALVRRLRRQPKLMDALRRVFRVLMLDQMNENVADQQCRVIA